MALTQIQQDGLSANALSAITASVLAPGAIAGNVLSSNALNTISAGILTPGAIAGNVLSSNAFTAISSNVLNSITAGTGITVSSAIVNGANVLVINSAASSSGGGFNSFLLAGM
jgi:hypothetical protein